jgi:cell pole-organizing protein PopZ
MKGVAMAKPAKRTNAPAKTDGPAGQDAMTPASAPTSPKSSHPGRKLAGVVLSIAAQRLLAAGVKRLIRRLR